MNKQRKKLDLDNFDVIKPDQFNLDKECCIQPRLVFDYLKEKAEADARIDGLKAELKVVTARLKRVTAKLDRRIRKRPERFGIDKLTEPAIANAILLERDYKNAESEVWRIEALITEAFYNRNLLEAASKALDHRKSSIENLVKLYGMNYFSTPKTEGDNKEAINNMKMRRSTRQSKRRKTK